LTLTPTEKNSFRAPISVAAPSVGLEFFGRLSEWSGCWN